MKRMPLVLLLLALTASPAAAAGQEHHVREDTGRVVYDALVLRPLGFVQMLVSAALFPVFYPVALPFDAGDEVVDICISQPIERTFRRPLGEL